MRGTRREAQRPPGISFPYRKVVGQVGQVEQPCSATDFLVGHPRRMSATPDSIVLIGMAIERWWMPRSGLTGRPCRKNPELFDLSE
jgi:hypothetical protein